MKNLKSRFSDLSQDKELILILSVVASIVLIFIFWPKIFWGIMTAIYGAALLPLLAVGAVLGVGFLFWKVSHRRN